MISINRTEYFELAHNLYPYDGKCYSLHGHSYKVTVEITGPQQEPLGMVIDFNILKEIMKKAIPDHAYLYDIRLLDNEEENNIVPKLVKLLNDNNMFTVGYPCTTTCENLVKIWADEINKILVKEYGLDDVYVSKLTANETQNSQATYIPNIHKNPYSKDFNKYEFLGLLDEEAG